MNVLSKGLPPTLWGVVGLAALVLAGCAGSGAGQDRRSAEAPEIYDLRDFTTYLAERNLRVLRTTRLTGGRQFVSSAENVYELTLEAHPGFLYVYQYKDAASAEADARRLDFGSLTRVRQGGIDFRGRYHPMVTTREAPVFRNGPLIVAYIGDDIAVQNALSEAMDSRIR